MAQPLSVLPQRKFGETSRTDKWWAQPLTVFSGLVAFIIYANWAALQGTHYTHGNLLSPFYSPVTWYDPEMWADGAHHAWFGVKPDWWPGWLPFSPALIILIFPLSFRLTCYYYRGAYYKAFWADPPNCAVGEPRKGYLGERHFPLVLQNIHRFALYFALAFIVILTYDAWRGLWFETAAGGEELGLSIGTIVLTVNVVLLGAYTLGCHSLRHLVGGRLVSFSKKPIQYNAWKCVTCLNERHMRFAWLSLFWVGFSDFYVRMCAMGVISDWRIF